MVASGNDFVVIATPKLLTLARKVCDRKYGIGADGLLLLEKSKKADIRMRIFNVDGSEAEMCGNGARCTALWAKSKNLKIETKAGIIESEVVNSNVKIKLTDPKDIKLGIPIRVNNRLLKLDFINTGVPHAVIFVEGLEKIEVSALGREIRYHRQFAPAGTNVNFVEVVDNNSIQVRTYERGVEDETLACGTGSVASALIFALKSGAHEKIKVHTRGGEIIRVYFMLQRNRFSDVWLEGKVSMVFKGEFLYQ